MRAQTHEYSRTPQVPVDGSVSVGVRVLGGGEQVATRSPTSFERTLQPSLARIARSQWKPAGGTALTVEGATALTPVGTPTARTVATSNRAVRSRRIGAVAATAAGSLAGFYSTQALWTIGTGAGNGGGGFMASFLFVPADPSTAASPRMFVGMSSNVAAPTNVDPSTLTNSIGVAQNAASSNLQIVYGGSTAQAVIDLGANFPAGGLSADLYELILSAEPQDTTVGYTVTRLNTGNQVSGVLANASPGVSLPAATTLLAPRLWRTNNAGTVAVAVDLVGLTIEADQ